MNLNIFKRKNKQVKLPGKPIESNNIFSGLDKLQNPLDARMSLLKICIEHVNDSHGGKHPDFQSWENELNELMKINNMVHCPESGVYTIKGVQK